MKVRQIEIRKQANLSADRHIHLIGDWAEHRIGFINGAEWADRHPHWISIKEELPKENGWYLVCNNIHDYGHCLYEIAEYNARFRSWIWAHTVTHWMPLPQPPVVSKTENTGKKGGAQ